jgi:uncharacterized membrane protein
MSAAGDGGVPGKGVSAMTRGERAVERLLLAVLGLSVAFMLAGVGLAVAGDGELTPGVTAGGDVLAGLARLEPGAYLDAGIVCLIATPFLRVIGALVLFSLERDRRFMAVTSVVLLIMMAGVALGSA